MADSEVIHCGNIQHVKTSEPFKQNIVSNCEKKYYSLNFPTRRQLLLKKKSVWLQLVATIQISQPPTKKKNKTEQARFSFISNLWESLVRSVFTFVFSYLAHMKTPVVPEGIILMARLVPTCSVSGCLGITCLLVTAWWCLRVRWIIVQLSPFLTSRELLNTPEQLFCFFLEQVEDTHDCNKTAHLVCYLLLISCHVQYFTLQLLK